ncbi:MAG: molybdopterin-dependent oxidoreductase [Chloroflexota bacterium]
MTDKISRRDFLKLAGLGAATTAVLTGCGTASRYVVREPYTKMPEYAYNGLSTYFATTCRECSAGCGLVVRTHQGRALKVEGNPNHPVNLGKTCARGQAALHGLYNPDRVQNPTKQSRAAALKDEQMTWDSAVSVVADAIRNTPAAEVAFLVGLAPDHIFDLFSDLASALGASAPVRFGALGMFEARATLTRAAADLFGQSALPFFDVAGADVVFSFGANFLETWLSPVAYTRGYSKMRRGLGGQRGHFVQFEARMSQTASKADEWIPVKPGTEGLVALAIGRLAAEARGGALPSAFANVNVEKIAAAADVSLEVLQALANTFAGAAKPLAVVGGASLGHTNGLQTAKAVLALNALAGNLGQPGGLYLSPLAPNENSYHRPASMKEMAAFVEKMRSGKIATLFVHGVNPVFELPKSLGFGEALGNVKNVISFATFPDETALASDYIFPDHSGLESWGYQRIATGTHQPALSGAQPAVAPFYNTRSTVDVILAAAAALGGKAAESLPFADEVAFVQSKLLPLVQAEGGYFSAPEINTFMAYFQQYGGWWQTAESPVIPAAGSVLSSALPVDFAAFEEGEFFFLPFVSPVLGEAGANKPWLQEIADPTTTVMWNSWVEVNPETAHELGLENDDVVLVTSAAGAVEAVVYVYPAIRPDTIAVPFGQGHTAYGRYAAGRGANPADLLGLAFNEAGDLAFAGMKVRIDRTGRKRELSRLESRIGVYGEGLEEH